MIENLLKLINEHPELDVVPIVNLEFMVGDDVACWMGCFGDSRIVKFLLGDEHFYFYDENDVEDVLIDVMGYDEYSNLSDDEALNKYKSLDWRMAIIIDVNLP